MEHKSELFNVFKDYATKSESHFNLKLVNLYCDNGREYLSNETKNYCIEKDISYHLTVRRTPQLNGVAERMNRTITEKARAMIAGANLDKNFWGDAVLTATYLINKSPTRGLKQDKTPFELWHGKKPQIKYSRIFDGYKAWNVEKEKYFVVRDTIIDEINFLKSRPVANVKEIGCKKSRSKIEIF